MSVTQGFGILLVAGGVTITALVVLIRWAVS